MENKYKIFDIGFNKILDLVESADQIIANYYKRLVKMLPENVVDAVSGCVDFATDCDEFAVDFMRFQNAVSLDYARNKDYLRFEIYVQRLYEDDLGPKKLFSINIRNTTRKQPDLQVYYEYEDSKLKFVRTSDKDYKKNIDVTFEVLLAYEDFEPYLICKSYYRGIVNTEKRVDISFDELTQYLEDEEPYEEEMEFEFDADFNL